jgi:hypothetical protein
MSADLTGKSGYQSGFRVHSFILHLQILRCTSGAFSVKSEALGHERVEKYPIEENFKMENVILRLYK